MYWEVALLSPPYSCLTYTLPDYFHGSYWSAGLRVCVPLGKSWRCGVLLRDIEQKQGNYTLKPIFWPLEFKPLLSPAYMELILDLSRRYLAKVGHILASVLPANLRRTDIIMEPADELQFPSPLKLSQLSCLAEDQLYCLADLWSRGRVSIKKFREDPRFYCIAKDPPWNIRPQATRQLQLLEFLWEKGPCSSRGLSRELGSWVHSCLPVLKEKELITKREDPCGQNSEISCNLTDFQLTYQQRQVLQSLYSDLDKSEGNIRLLYGITGSGKTLVYFMLLQACLEKGWSAMLLVPEVGLAVQIWSQIRSYFSHFNCYLYHGYLASGRRGEIFQEISQNKEPTLIIGTRSAVFLPRDDLGLIILDEEHDPSFKQEERLNYHTKDIAYYWTRRCRTLLVLGSATPDIKTFHAAKVGFFPMSCLTRRVGDQHLPNVELVDLNKEPSQEGPFSLRTHHKLQECLKRGEQAIILLNRRGFAPLVYCTSCRSVMKCDHCEVALTYHKKRERLICHFCGSNKPFPLPCPQCGSHQFLPISEGTEQVEEYIASRLEPNVGVLRLDRDTTRRQGSMEEIFERFSSGQAQVMVGTQMCSKGHHFPRVTLVAVIDGDLGLNLPDYRATERTYQLLVQVSGRAGRGEVPGEVIIQTRNPGHHCWKYIVNNDYESFYEKEIAVRRKYYYPPFIKLGLLRMNFPASFKDGQRKVQEIARALKEKGSDIGVQVLGPAPAPLGKLKGRYRYQCLIKAQNWQQIRNVYAQSLNKVKPKAKIRLHLDLDPLQML